MQMNEKFVSHGQFFQNTNFQALDDTGETI